MESNPFLPTFPPRWAFFFTFFISLFFVSTASQAGFVANFTTLKNRSRTEALVYVQNVQRLLKTSEDRRISCKNGKMPSDVFCKGFINRQQLSELLKYPEFSRMRWNAETIKVSTACNKSRTKTCMELLTLKGQFFRKKRVNGA